MVEDGSVRGETKLRLNIRMSGFDALNRDFAELISAAETSVVRTSNFVAQSTAQRAKYKIRTGSRSGRVYQTSRGPHQASAPGEPPASLTGDLAASITHRKMTKSSDVISVGSNSYYAKTLEFGGFNEQGRYIAARPFLYPAFREAIAQAKGKLKAEFEREMRRR